MNETEFYAMHHKKIYKSNHPYVNKNNTVYEYRLEVEIEWENEEQTVGIVGIDEISKHYQ